MNQGFGFVFGDSDFRNELQRRPLRGLEGIPPEMELLLKPAGRVLVGAVESIAPETAAPGGAGGGG